MTVLPVARAAAVIPVRIASGKFQGAMTTPAGEIPATGKAFVIGGAGALTVVDGRIVNEALYFDAGDFIRQLTE